MPDKIEARGVRVHNLKNIDVSIPLGRLTVVTGVSGSGKSSLAFDTLYAEGQRRYVECFSAWARRYLDQLPRPDVDRVEHIPPAVAIRQHRRNQSPRATVATATELDDYLRMLFARVGTRFCPDCDTEVVAHTPEDVVNSIESQPPGLRLLIGFEIDESMPRGTWLEVLNAEGLQRVVFDGATHRILELTQLPDDGEVLVVLDRLQTGADRSRMTESVESAFEFSGGGCVVACESAQEDGVRGVQIDDRAWALHRFFDRPACPRCLRQFEALSPAALSFNSSRGACETCTGFGSVPTFRFDKVVPDDGVSLRDGAIVPWTTPAYRHELDELIALADDYDVPLDIPFRDLDENHRQLIADGVPERAFGGLRGFFDWLQRHRYKKGVGVFLSRWRSFDSCPACEGTRLNPMARSARLGETRLPEIYATTIDSTLAKVREAFGDPPEATRAVAAPLLSEIESILDYLNSAGLGYLTPDRAMRTLSAGESQRVALTAALGSSLVNTLYVLDEPTAGLHAVDTQRIVRSIARLRDAGNTLVVVEHDADVILQADHVIDIGPGAGAGGGEVVAAGEPDQIADSVVSATAEVLKSARQAAAPEKPRRDARGALKLQGAATHNLRDVDVSFPLGVLCVVTGVSGSGKSSLIEQTLYPALCRRFGLECSVDEPGRWQALTGADELANVVLLDQQPIGRTPRSIPATYLKVFAEIRSIYAGTSEAKKRAFTPGTFSFNTATGGRCPRCEGAGFVTVDMEFLADVEMVCPECDGSRYRPEVLEPRFRGLSIADVLAHTADEAFVLFRGHGKVQRKLKVLRDTGLGYLPLGQPATTLSGGEAQRLKMAAHLAGLAGKAQRQTARDRFSTLFLLDEPSIGLHGRDVQVLLNCFDALLEAGHSLVVVEHHQQIIAAADHVIDLGPGAGDAGGRIVAQGTPAEIMQTQESLTGAALRRKP